MYYIVRIQMLPMYKEYLENYKLYSSKYGNKVAIFLMVGMFYEMYDVRSQDGETATSFTELTDILGLKVVVKKDGNVEALSAGIPESAVHRWAGRLTGLGWTVVLIDQVMNAGNTVMKRAVQRILTPGSHIEAATLSDMYLTFVTIKSQTQKTNEPPILAVTALDLTTGHLHVFETQAQGTSEAWTSNDILQFMELYPPREVLWSVDGHTVITESKLKGILGCQNTIPFHQRSPINSGAWVKPAFREEYLRTHCGLKSLLPTHVALHIASGSNVETALLSLLYALEELWPSMNLGSLLVYPWVAGSSLRLGENALVQLHMITDDHNAKQDVLGLFDKCSTPMGHRGLRTRLLKPSADPRHIVDNLDAVDFWIQKMAYQDEISATLKRLKTMSDVHRLYRKIQQGTVTASDIISIDTTLKATEWIQRTITTVGHNVLGDLQDIRTNVFKVFSIDKCYGDSEDTSIFVSDLMPSLDSLESQIQTKHDAIREWISTCAKAAGVSPDTFKPEFRDKSLVIKGPRGAIQTLKISNKLPPNTVAVTNKSASYLESPELDQLFSSLSRLRESLKQQQSVTLIEQGTALAETLMVPWMRIADWITYVDVNLTLARVATEMGYVRPDIVDAGDSSMVRIEGLRHPILEAQDRKIPYVQHTVSLTPENQGWLLYGLNASGKSSLMRATGLAVLLAQAGSYVPASKMSLVPFSSLHTRIINTDNLWMGLSSFAVEMSEMRDIFREAGPRSLVLGDELCSGTETTSATALVAAGLRGLLKRGAKFLFATHLHGLVQIPEVLGDIRLKIWHLHVEYDTLRDKLVYHRTLREGSGSSLYGLEVAKAMRIPDDILEDAIRFRKQLAGESELSESVGSAWNSNVIRRKCEKCGLTEIGVLEVHHIKERRTATNPNGRLADGSDLHGAANLVVLCDKCHDDVHGGEVNIGPLIQTSDGPERSITSVASESRKSKWSEEELRTIESVCNRFPSLSPSGLSKYLLNQHEIQISGGSLRKMRS